MFKLCVYVPENTLETVKEAMFAAGGGVIGNYAKCSWQCRGEGQFLPLEGSDPTVGGLGQIETVIEYKLEMVCEVAVLESVLAALREAHPYEEPAFQFWRVNDPVCLSQ